MWIINGDMLNKERVYTRLFLYKAIDLSQDPSPDAAAMNLVDEAIARYEKLQKSNNTASTVESIASCYRTKGVLYSKASHPEEAIQAFAKSVELFEALKNLRTADSYYSLAATHFEWAQHFLRVGKKEDAFATFRSGHPKSKDGH